MFEYDDMSEDQKKALESLRRASKKADQSGLQGFGSSGSFFVYPQDWNVIENGHMNALPYQCSINNFHCDGGDT